MRLPNPEGPFTDVVHQIGEKGDLTQERAASAARHFIAALQEYPGAEHAIIVGGFDGDPRELWDVPEVRAYVQCFVACAVRYSGLPVPAWRLGASSMAFVAVCLGLARVVGRDRWFNRVCAWFRPAPPPRATLICMRLADMYLVHPDMVEGVCSQCSKPVGIYPSGQQVITDFSADRVDVVCHICHPPGRYASPAPGALSERGVPRA